MPTPSPATLLVVYCVLIVLASLVGGLVPLLVRLTHRRLELALSFVSGVMLGVAVLHMLPHALVEHAAAEALVEAAAHDHDHGHDHAHDHGHGHGHAHEAVAPTVIFLWLLGGFLAMFLIERFFSFHQHGETDDGADDAHVGGACAHGHATHRITWSGAAIGLTLHTLIAGIALAASVKSGTAHGDAAGPFAWAGLGTFLVIFLHKPFDALTIGALMAAGRHSTKWRHVVNFLFSLAIPVGAAMFMLGVTGDGPGLHRAVGAALAFSAGSFLCIALSDLLPELQFHQHDRLKLSLALITGLVLAWLIAIAEHA